LLNGPPGQGIGLARNVITHAGLPVMRTSDRSLGTTVTEPYAVNARRMSAMPSGWNLLTVARSVMSGGPAGSGPMVSAHDRPCKSQRTGPPRRLDAWGHLGGFVESASELCFEGRCVWRLAPVDASRAERRWGSAAVCVTGGGDPGQVGPAPRRRQVDVDHPPAAVPCGMAAPAQPLTVGPAGRPPVSMFVDVVQVADRGTAHQHPAAPIRGLEVSAQGAVETPSAGVGVDQLPIDRITNQPAGEHRLAGSQVPGQGGGDLRRSRSTLRVAGFPPAASRPRSPHQLPPRHRPPW
jgi:hypothetical protein